MQIKNTHIIIVIILFLFNTSCSKKNNKVENLISIVESNIINNNKGEILFTENRNSDLFTFVDTSKATYTINVEKQIMIRSSRKGLAINLKDFEEKKLIKTILESKKIMDSLKIKSIFPERKKFAIYTNIEADLDYKKEKPSLLNLVNFKNSDLTEELITELKNKDSVEHLIGDWFYYKYDRK